MGVVCTSVIFKAVRVENLQKYWRRREERFKVCSRSTVSLINEGREEPEKETKKECQEGDGGKCVVFWK
jgi:hypothetical protein